MEFSLHYNRALKAFTAGQLDRAKRELSKALSHEPANASALDLLGIITLKRDGATDDVAEIFERALRYHPANASLLNNYGKLAWERGELNKARALFRRSVENRPKWGKAWSNLATVSEKLGLTDDAIDSYRKCLSLKSRSPRQRLRLARLLEIEKRFDEALDVYEDAVRVRPDHAKSRFCRGLLNLKLGLYPAGWEDFEWRFAIDTYPRSDSPSWRQLEWDGQSFEGKTLLIQQEQGFGDAIQMARYLPLVKTLGGRVLLHCRPRLFRLLESLDGVDRLLNRNIPIDRLDEAFDLRISMMSLPRVLGTEFANIPNELPYLRVDPELVEAWSRRVDKSSFNIGLVWSGRPQQLNNDDRSMSLMDLQPLTDIEGITLYSLQKGAGKEELKAPPDGFRIKDYTGDFEDFADTAALIKNLDLVITVDTSVAHLAGAIGHRVWTLLWSNHCWRYTAEHEESPWYPRMRLFRQSTPWSWKEPIANVVDSLRALIASRNG